jgi:small subunit ribosomal protein S9
MEKINNEINSLDTTSFSWYTGIGKRKTSVAKVFVKEGSGKIQINNKSLEEFFSGMNEEKEAIKNPFIVVNLANLYDITVDVKGGGISSQLDSIKLAISKAICQMNKEYRQILKKHMFLRRDSRIKERRKYGLKKARKASQYSKR